MSYKTFTATIDTPTVLDGFVPAALTDIESRFAPLQAIESDSCALLREGAEKLTKFSDFEALAKTLTDSATALDYLFSDYSKRLQYFTLVFFGAVSAGKTSMICDLANTTPSALSAIIQGQPGFNATTDEVSIGPNVATMNLYEILIEKSRIRLVDVPGIGGVVHSNDTLAPFVNIADCIVFMLNAGSDIMKDDDDFLFNHVAALRSSGAGHSHATSERGVDKRVLVVINKWGSVIKLNNSVGFSEKAFEIKREWILHGRKDVGFKGIAGYFQKQPEVVRADTSVRDPETGNPIGEADLKEVVEALENVLAEDGVDFRLNRPRLALIRTLSSTKNALTDEATTDSLRRIQRQYELLSKKASFAATTIQQSLDDRLGRLEQTLSFYISSRLKQVIFNWKPKVGFLRGLQGAVPEWFGLAQNVGLGKTEMQKELKAEWEGELHGLIEKNMPANELSEMVSREADAIQQLVMSTFQMNLLDSPDVLEKLSSMPNRAGNGENKVDLMNSFKKDLEEAVSKIQTGVMDDIIGLLTVDAIMAAIAGVFLTPLASVILIAYRRWMRGEKKGQAARQELDQAVDNTARETASKIRNQIAERFQQGLKDLSSKIGSLISEQQDSAAEPLAILEKLSKQLSDILNEIEGGGGERSESVGA